MKCEEDEIISYSIVDLNLEGRSLCNVNGQNRFRCLDSLSIHFPKFGNDILTTCGAVNTNRAIKFEQDGEQELIVDFKTNRAHQLPGFLIFVYCNPISAPFVPTEDTPEATDESSESESSSSARRTTDGRSNFLNPRRLGLNLRLGRMAADVGSLRLEEEIADLRPQTETFGTSCTKPVDISDRRFKPDGGFNGPDGPDSPDGDTETSDGSFSRGSNGISRSRTLGSNGISRSRTRTESPLEQLV